MGVHVALFVAAVTVGALTSRSADWQPIGLLVALAVLAVGSDLLALRFRGLLLSANFAAIMLAAVLLGPAPAMTVAGVPLLVSAYRDKLSASDLASNLATFATFPLVAGLLVQALAIRDQPGLRMAATVMAVFMATNFLNFVMIYCYRVLAQGWFWKSGLREMYAPVVPAQLGIGMVTVGVVYAERSVGVESIVLLAPIVLIFQWLLRTAINAFERGVALGERNRELASLQFGLISSLIRTLALRDNGTARHSAAVARYSRAMAAALGLPDSEQERIHTAALFHDIGKFIFPDSILQSRRRLTEEEFEIVRRHPAVGADVIREIEGYGPVAEVVLHHHERVDGMGYPIGLLGTQIPLGSRIIAVADAYDVITARDTYQDPRSMAEAFAELRRSAGTQLDADLVELFIALMKEGGVVFRHAVAEDFEAELALERRVSDYATPRRVA